MKRAAPLAAALLLAGSLPAGAQGSGVHVTVAPHAGVHLSAVPFRKKVALADDFTLRYRYGFRPAPVFGVTVGIAADALPFGLRAQLGSAPELTLEDEP